MCADCGDARMAFVAPVGLARGGARGRVSRRRAPTAVAPRPAVRARVAPTARSSGLFDGPRQMERVVISAPAPNRRVVRSEAVIGAPLHVVWGVLSDYGRLAEYIPNLAMSKLRPHPRKGGIRLEQCGTQRILGFEFRASVTMDMVEVERESEVSRAIDFVLVDSRDFRVFEGTWRMQGDPAVPGKTLLTYEVAIVPRGFVPVKAIEWRIGEDVPQNMDAVKRECEARTRKLRAAARRDAIRAQQQ